jgi:predicted metal-dependent hydrolase
MKYWCDNSAVWTHYGNASSIIFPAWERAFAAVINHHLPNVSDEDLRSRMIKFVQEELSHANAHESFNERHGLKDEEQKEFANTKMIHRRPGMTFWLGTMVSIEHLASCMARSYIDRWGSRESRDFKLFCWHAKEELGHKTLALDLWDHLGLPRSELRKIARVNQRYVLKFLLGYTLNKLKEDGVLHKPSTWKDLVVCFGYVGIKIGLPMLRIYLPGFHPDNIDDTRYLQAA